MRNADHMNGLPYYRAYPRDFFEGTVGMSLELKGAYRIVIDLIYMQNGMLPDDAGYIAGLLGCSKRKWTQTIRAGLIEAGKIEVVTQRIKGGGQGQFITNARADRELGQMDGYRAEMQASTQAREIIRRGVAYLSKSGRSEEEARRIFDGWRDAHSMKAITAALTEAFNAGLDDPVQFVTDHLRGPQPKAPPPPRQENPRDAFRTAFLAEAGPHAEAIFAILSFYYVDGGEGAGREQGKAWGKALDGCTAEAIRSAGDTYMNGADPKRRPKPTDIRKLVDKPQATAAQSPQDQAEAADLRIAEWIKQGRRYLLAHTTPSHARRLIEQGLVTEQQCRDAGVAA